MILPALIAAPIVCFAVSAADLESPLSKPHVHAKSPAQRLAQTLARCLPNSFLPQSIAAEF
jgi:hypothetical protein